MWILLAFISATLLGLYDTSKKYSLRGNDVIPVLFLNTLFCMEVCFMWVSEAGKCIVG